SADRYQRSVYWPRVHSRLRHGPAGPAREILRALGGNLAVKHAGGLAALDEVPVRVPHVAAGLRPAVDRRRDELRPLRLPLLVAGPDVGDPPVWGRRGGGSR